jgi:hypothetical protein
MAQAPALPEAGIGTTVRTLLPLLGRMGGEGRAKSLGIARKAAETRWKKPK